MSTNGFFNCSKLLIDWDNRAFWSQNLIDCGSKIECIWSALWNSEWRKRANRFASPNGIQFSKCIFSFCIPIQWQWLLISILQTISLRNDEKCSFFNIWINVILLWTAHCCSFNSTPQPHIEHKFWWLQFHRNEFEFATFTKTKTKRASVRKPYRLWHKRVLSSWLALCAH